MKNMLLPALVALLFQSVASGDKVTFHNSTDGDLLVRCISGGNVSATNEYRYTIRSGRRHFRRDFAKGVRAAVAWSADRRRIATTTFRVQEGLELTIIEHDDGGIEFACAACAGHTTAHADPPVPQTIQLSSKRARPLPNYAVRSLFTP